MNQRRSFYRKLGYAVAIAVLLIPLSMLSRPEIRGASSPDGQGDPGGKLSRLRTEYKLSQSNLGEIDPASETMKFATLGLKGLASTILWNRATDYKMKEDWSNFETTLNQLIKLQPNYIGVWQHQAWNVSYNLSVEFDDYRDRYYYVMRGIDFLKEGIQYNEEHPVLLSDLGWFTGQKIGRADEHKEYRRLFREDSDYHPEDRVGRERDNWIVGRDWYLRAYRAVEELGKPLQTATGKEKGELLFFHHAPMCLMNYGEALEEEGTFGDVAMRAWDQAGTRWYLDEEPDPAYGNRLLKHSSGMRFTLNELEKVKAKQKAVEAALDALVPGVREILEQERRESLPKEQQLALEIAPENLTEETFDLTHLAEDAIEVSSLDVAHRFQKDHPKEEAKGNQAIRLAREVFDAEVRARRIRSYRDITNFVFWRTRTQFEKTDNAISARALTIEADKAHEAADFARAKKTYEESFSRWKAVFEEFPEVAENSIIGSDILEVIGRYRRLLEEMEFPFPEDFILWNIIELHDGGVNFGELLEARWTKQAGRPEDSNEQDNEEQGTEKESSD